MCGIAGIMMKDGEPSFEQLQKLGQALQHRGPDGLHIHQEGRMGLVHTRLAIIDVEGGDQPFFDQEGNCLIVNGEIYNYLELRQQFREEEFKTHSDCETILPLYHKYSLDFVNHLRGMYAFALYNKNTNQLILARDPFGIKPLYYAFVENGFVFASEPQALIKAGFVNPLLNEAKASEVLELRYSTENQTPFSQIKRLMPGEVIIIEKEIFKESFIQKALPDPQKIKQNYKTALHNLDRILDDSLVKHLRSDVPYGLFLSGGIDSSALLALMKRHISQPIKTFTIGFPDSTQHDERSLAGKLATTLKTDHTEMEFTENDFWTLLPHVMNAVDDPTLDFATLPTYKMAKVAKKDVKVILCGEGGDELFGGYGRYQKAKRHHLLGGLLFKRKGMLEELDVSKNQTHHWKDIFNETLKYNIDSRYTNLQKAQSLDVSYWLPNDLLTKLDRCLMAHGIEGRTPFLDLPLAEAIFNLPDHMKIRWRTRKWLLRHWLNENLPIAEPFSRKRGFTVPVLEWMNKKSRELSELVSEQAGIQQLCYPEKVKEIFLSHNPDAANAKWNLFSFALWHQIHILRLSVGDHALETLSQR